MRITVLLENATPSSRYVAKHGLSLYIEACGTRLLFDLGPDESFLRNACALGVDVCEADAVAISHGHYDHGGGLGAYLDATAHLPAPAPVYVRRGAFAEHASGTCESHHDIGLDRGLAGNPRIIETDGICRIAPGLTLFSGVGGNHARPASNACLLERTGGALEQDAFCHEQSLLVEEDGLRVLVSGCSHAGILNIIERAEEVAAAPLDHVVAGFHLTAPSAGRVADEDAVRSLARELADRKSSFHTFHCTGLTAFSLLRDELGPRIDYLYTGSRISLAR